MHKWSAKPLLVMSYSIMPKLSVGRCTERCLRNMRIFQSPWRNKWSYCWWHSRGCSKFELADKITGISTYNTNTNFGGLKDRQKQPNEIQEKWKENIRCRVCSTYYTCTEQVEAVQYTLYLHTTGAGCAVHITLAQNRYRLCSTHDTCTQQVQAVQYTWHLHTTGAGCAVHITLAHNRCRLCSAIYRAYVWCAAHIILIHNRCTLYGTHSTVA